VIRIITQSIGERLVIHWASAPPSVLPKIAG
jgi:hypothetical protein